MDDAPMPSESRPVAPIQAKDQDELEVDAQPNEATAPILYGCPVCGDEFRRMQDRHRHIKSHLPYWILCPFQGCTWTGHRQQDLKEHWRKKHSKTGQVPVDYLYDPRAFVNMILEGMPVYEVLRSALAKVQEGLERLRKRANVLEQSQLQDHQLDSSMELDSGPEVRYMGIHCCDLC